MKTAFHLTVTVLLLISTTATAYEFRSKTVSRDTGLLMYEEAKPSADYSGYGGTDGRRVTTTVRPEECRFYLTYVDEGRDHTALLREAKLVGQQLAKALADVEQAKVEMVPLNYSPEKSWRGLFVGEKSEISVTFRVTIDLVVEGENAFWENAGAVARVLESLSEVRKDADWGKKLSQGRVAYAIESIEPTKQVLCAKVEEEVKAFRNSLSAANERAITDVLVKIHYGNPSTSRVTLEQVEVVLPYSVEIVLGSDWH